ncbi:hypothetical protein [Maridesulfovibrio sp. FT414]|uniref:hypothetical protein n=1 Tax=Maridesulfovibrio sp. FT414 TaxID=2979469 RepID=UPI003D80036E
MLEFFRRAVALLLICLGGYMVIWPGGRLIIAEPFDFRPGYEKKLAAASRKGIEETTQTSLSSALVAEEEAGTLSDYIDSETNGRKLIVSGPEWHRLSQIVKEPDKYPDLKNREYGFSKKSYIFHPQEPPFDQIRPVPTESVYISVGNGQNWIRARSDHAGYIYALPDRFLYPYFHHGLGLIACGFLLYFVLPRMKFAEDEIHYPRGATVTVPDMMGLVLVPIFFLLPFLIVWGIDSGTSILSVSKGWIWLTGAMWLLAAVWMMLLITAFRFSSLRYRLTKEGFHELRGNRDILFRWEDIEYCQYYRTTLSSKLSTLLLIFGTTLQAVGMGLMLRGQEEHGIRIHERGGRKIKVMANALDEFNDIVRAMKERGIKCRPRKKD